jgi:tetratricopeptide (TPR) repeat protein
MTKYIFRIFFLIILALTTTAYAQMTFEQRSIDNDLSAAASLIRIGDYQHAEVFLQKIRLNYGDDNRILILIKQLYREAKAYTKLEDEIKQEINKDPVNPMLLIELGEARFLQDDNRSADSLWNKAIQTAGKDAGIYYMLADAKLRYGLNDDAAKVYLTGRSNLNDPALFSMELAGIYESIKDYPLATDEYLTQALQSPEKLALVLTKVRGMIEDDDSPAEIISVIERRIKESSGKPELYEVMGDVYIKQNRMDKALECYKAIGIKQNDDGQSMVRFASRAFDSRAYTTSINAVDEYFKLTQYGLLKDMAVLIRAKSLMASGQSRQALNDFKVLYGRALDYRIKDESGFSAGLIYAQDLNQCDSALVIWDSVSKSGQDQTFMTKTRLEMAICYLRNDKVDQAKQTLQMITTDKKADSNTERAIFLLAEITFFEGQFHAALGQYSELVKQYPQGDYSNDALTRTIVIAATKGDSTSPALKKYADAMKAEDLGDYSQTAEILDDDIFNGSPIYEQALYFSSISYARAGQREKAINGLKRYIDGFADGTYIDRAYCMLGDLYGQDPATYSNAKSMYNKVLEAFPNSPMIEQARKNLAPLSVPGKIG